MRFFVLCCRILILGVKFIFFNFVVGLVGIFGGVCVLVMVGFVFYKLWKFKVLSSVNGVFVLVDGLVCFIKVLGKGGRVYIDYFKVLVEELMMRGFIFEFVLFISFGVLLLIVIVV